MPWSHPNERTAAASGTVEFRVGLGSCGVANGARPVHEAVEAAVREAGAGAVKAVGCGGSCYREPLVEVVDGNGLHARLHPRHARSRAGDRPAPPAAEGTAGPRSPDRRVD